MSKSLNLLTKRFGQLVVIARIGNTKWNKSRWLCLCDCGNQTMVQGVHLCNGDTKSCGCLVKKHAKIMGLNNGRHGHKRSGKRTRLYNIWGGIIERCCNPSYRDYDHYGGRGITVCERWKQFEYFLADMGDPLTNKHQIDRINNNKGYFLANCRWTTATINNRNKRNNRLLNLHGKIQCVTVWSEEVNLSIQTIMWRVNNGWSIEKSLTTPIRKRRD